MTSLSPLFSRWQRMRKFLCWAAVGLASATVDAGAAGLEAPPEHELSARRSLYEGDEGTTCSDFLAGVLPWERPGGDWRDARGKIFGDQPYAEGAPSPNGVILDVTGLVRKWVEAGNRRGILAVRAISGTGYANFFSRKAKGPADWPMLVLDLAGDRREMLKPSADTHIDCSTYRSLGRSETLPVTGKINSLLQFQLPAAVSAKSLVRAQLVLSSASPPGGGALRVGVFEVAVPSFPMAPVRQGLASDYPGDKGIERNPDVVFATGFEELLNWRWRWAKDSAGEFEVVSDDWGNRFEPLMGKALRVNLKKGSNYGADLRLYLRDLGGEVDELFFRYYLRFGDDWNPTVDGGKLPGLAGTYGKAGWGGRRSDGTNGWALRGGFLRAFPSDHPMHGLTQVSTYAYHADMQSEYGDRWIWPGAVLQRNRWYCIEQQVRMNYPSAADGELRVWVDGRLVMERKNVRLRTVDRLHIETVWLDVYHGGLAPSPHDQHLYIDNVVVARRYIGPMAARSADR